jgi:hypothetical protein
MTGVRLFVLVGLAALAAAVGEPGELRALDPQQQEAPSDCLGPADPFCTSGGGSTSGGGGTTCTVTSKCFAGGIETGSVSCSGRTCSRGTGWVKCDGNTTYCGR